MKIKWIFFDVGSTLVDETKVYERRFAEIAEAAGVSADYVAEQALEFYKQNRKGDKEILKKLNVKLPKWESEYEELYPDTENILKDLHEKYKIGIIANQDFGTADRLQNFGILKYIDLVVASAEEGVAKPDKRIFDIALERAGVIPEEAFMIGDRIDNDSLLETTLNTRDLGDYIGGNGKPLRLRQLIRSDRQAYPNGRDLEFLRSNGITTIIDMRTPDDISGKPSAFSKLDGFDYFNFPIQEGSQVPESVKAVPGSYMIIAGSPSLKDIFNKMAEAESGVMFNCSAGKDRTGVVSAIILMLCGVSEDDIVADYMLSKDYNRERFKMAAIHHPDLDINIIIPRESYIRDFMRLFKEKYGSVEGYFDSIGVSKENVEKIRNKMIS